MLETQWAVTFQQSTAAHDPEQVTEPNSRSTDILFSRKRKRAETKLEPEDFSRRMVLVNEAALILRNMIMMDFNADYISRLPTTRAFLVLILSLPQQANTAELQQYGLDMTEQLTRYMVPQDGEDQLFNALIPFLDRSDRGLILAAIRAICRFGMIPQQAPQLSLISPRTLQRLTSWMVLEDEDLRAAALDLLYQYTVRPSNVRTFTQANDTPSFVRQLVRLLLHGARYSETKEQATSNSHLHASDPASTTSASKESPIPLIPQPHVQHLLSYSEPDRSSAWLRSCFIESPDGEITQIALWQAYQLPFAPYVSTHPLLPAKDFITNVSNTFAKATAQVIQGDGGTPRFVIRGIKARAVPVDAKNRPFLKCLWSEDFYKDNECGAFAKDARGMWEHIVTTHLGLSKRPADDNGVEKWDLTSKPEVSYVCRWAGCRHFNKGQATTPFAVGMHVKTHMPDTSEKSFQRHKYNVSPTDGGKAIDKAKEAAQWRTTQTSNTALDERNEPAGLPLVSCLVLRNLARNLRKLAAAPPNASSSEVDNVESPEVSPAKLHREVDRGEGMLMSPRGRRGHKEAEDLVEKCFGPVREQIWNVMSVNGTLRESLAGLVVALEGEV